MTNSQARTEMLGQQRTPMGGSNADDLLVSEFFIRNGFDSRTRIACDSTAAKYSRDGKIVPTSHQGYCSYTVSISDKHLLQFRPSMFRLDMQICREAKDIYGALVPSVSYLGTIDGISLEGMVARETIHIYLQEIIQGISLDTFRKKTDVSSIHRKRLVQDLAGVYAKSYSHGIRPGSVQQSPQRRLRRGRVGSSLHHRLSILQKLPWPEVNHVHEVQSHENLIESEVLWCLTHGDIVPPNIMVDPQTGHLTGLIDWAEGEWLPFGTGLYGLEEVLGEVLPDGRTFQYYDDHESLRNVFWNTFMLRATFPPLSFPPKFVDYTRTCRQLGILLWRGIAFNDGKIDRIVDSEREALDLYKLQVFLRSPEPSYFAWRQQIWLSCVWFLRWISRSLPTEASRNETIAV